MKQFKPGQLCGRCGQPIWHRDDVDIDHADDGYNYRPNPYSHRACNRAATQLQRTQAVAELAAIKAGKVTPPQRGAPPPQPAPQPAPTPLLTETRPWWYLCCNDADDPDVCRKPGQPHHSGRCW